MDKTGRESSFVRSMPLVGAAVLAILVAVSLPFFRSVDSRDPNAIHKLEVEAREKDAPEGPAVYDIVYKRRLLHRLRLDVYGPLDRPSVAGGVAFTAADTAPVVVFFHGGSWVRGDKVTIRIVDRFLQRMREAGYFVVAVNYTDSLLRGIGGPVENAANAVRWVLKNASIYGFDPDRIGLYGVSAGGHVALLAGSPGAYDLGVDVSFIFAESAPTDLIGMRDGEAFGASNAFRVFPRATLLAMSPVTYVSEAMPPVLIFHGDADGIVHIDQARRYAAALRASGGEVLLVEFSGGGHAFLNFSDTVWYQQETRALQYFQEKFDGAAKAPGGPVVPDE